LMRVNPGCRARVAPTSRLCLQHRHEAATPFAD
jgi:hypothetical protein